MPRLLRTCTRFLLRIPKLVCTCTRFLLRTLRANVRAARAQSLRPARQRASSAYVHVVKCVQTRAQLQGGPETKQRWPQDGFKTAPSWTPICPQMAPRNREMTPQGRQSAPKIHRERSSGKHTNTRTHMHIYTRAQKQKSLSGRVHREARGIKRITVHTI